jgi:hypothetical protein
MELSPGTAVVFVQDGLHLVISGAGVTEVFIPRSTRGTIVSLFGVRVHSCIVQVRASHIPPDQGVREGIQFVQVHALLTDVTRAEPDDDGTGAPVYSFVMNPFSECRQNKIDPTERCREDPVSTECLLEAHPGQVVKGPSGYCYNRPSIQKWFTENQTDPMDRQRLDPEWVQQWGFLTSPDGRQITGTSSEYLERLVGSLHERVQALERQLQLLET